MVKLIKNGMYANAKFINSGSFENFKLYNSFIFSKIKYFFLITIRFYKTICFFVLNLANFI